MEEGHELNVSVVHRLADLLKSGAEGVEANPALVNELYNRVLNSGDADAMSSLALNLSLHIDGGELDPPWAVKQYTRAIDEGADAHNMVGLASLLENGSQGVAANPARAVALYKRAIDEHGNVGAVICFANLLTADTAQAAQLYKRAIDGCGDVSAVIGLANLLNGGADGVEANPARAVELYIRAMGDGDVFAMCSLRIC